METKKTGKKTREAEPKEETKTKKTSKKTEIEKTVKKKTAVKKETVKKEKEKKEDSKNTKVLQSKEPSVTSSKKKTVKVTKEQESKALVKNDEKTVKKTKKASTKTKKEETVKETKEENKIDTAVNKTIKEDTNVSQVLPVEEVKEEAEIEQTDVMEETEAKQESLPLSDKTLVSQTDSSSKSETYGKKYYKNMIIGFIVALIIVCCFSFLSIYNKNKVKNVEYTFQEISPMYGNLNYSICVPSNWIISNDYANFHVLDENKLNLKMQFSAGNLSQEEFDVIIDDVKANYDVKEDEINGKIVYGFVNEIIEAEMTQNYYFTYFDEVGFIMTIFNEDYNVGLDIITSVK